jgi:hypothetical protein
MTPFDFDVPFFAKISLDISSLMRIQQAIINKHFGNICVRLLIPASTTNKSESPRMYSGPSPPPCGPRVKVVFTPRPVTFSSINNPIAATPPIGKNPCVVDVEAVMPCP